MPLARAEGKLIPDLDGIHFPMQDHAGRHIRCSVTFDYLHDVGGMLTYETEQVLRVFAEFRSAIEAIASRKFDAGTAKVRVDIGDA
jgi:hypothetical protein